MNSSAGSAVERLARLGLQLPPPPVAIGAAEPFVVDGDLVHTSGQIAIQHGRLVATGRLGAELDLATGQQAARICALNVLAQLHAAAGSLDAVLRIVSVTAYVACTPEFDQQPQVADGASSLFLEVFGRAGAHARTAVGVCSLVRGTPVVVNATARIAS